MNEVCWYHYSLSSSTLARGGMRTLRAAATPGTVSSKVGDPSFWESGDIIPGCLVPRQDF